MSTIPPADVYIFEETINKPKHLGAVAISMKISNIEAMTIALLSARSNPTFVLKHSPIVLLKSKAIGKHFDLKFGSVCVSGQPVIDAIIEKNGYRSSGPRVELQDHVNQYNTSSPVLKEMFCKSLLLGLCFGDIICWKSNNTNSENSDIDLIQPNPPS